LGASGNFLRGHVYANGQLLATYTNTGTEFAFNDWLGSKRVVANADGSIAGTCINLPFGDELSCSGSVPLNGHHFTGQIHDQESANDYFSARYYSENTGRFLSPDPEGIAVPVPYGILDNPQTLNLYSYVLNNPLTNTDSDGHSVNVCTTGSDASQECTLLSNDQYQAAQQAGNGGLNVWTAPLS
jgi:RHS repeat-associated protein